MLDLSAAFFFFQLFYNIPSFTYFVWSSSIDLDVPRVAVIYQPLQVTNLKMLNTPSELELYARISVCQKKFGEAVKYDWKILPTNGHAYHSPSFNCSFIFQTTHYTSLRIAVSIRSLNGTLLARGDRFIQLDKTWIAVLGDSFASGEGNAEQVDPIRWQNEECHRSRKSFAYQTAKNLSEMSPNRTYQLSFLACSGASTSDLTEGHRSQLATLERIAKERNRGPDVVILTIGANDIGFTDILHALTSRFKSFDFFDSRFIELSLQLDKIASKLSFMDVPQVILPLYYDITRNENGEVDASCGAFGRVKTVRLAQAERKLLKKLNDLLRRKAESYGWTVVSTIPEIFSTRGVCSKDSLVISPEESYRTLQSFRGSFHPNEKGHKLIAEEILKIVN